METAVQKRNVSLDLIKALAILMVVFFHNIQLRSDGYIDNILMMICNSAVLLFFMTTGALLLSKPLDLKKHCKKTVTLCIVAIFWRAVYLLYSHFIFNVPVDASFGTLFGYLFLFQDMPGILASHFWYFQSLIAIYLLLPLLKKAVEDRRLTRYLIIMLILFAPVMFDLDLLAGILQKTTGKPLPSMLLFSYYSPFAAALSNAILCVLLGYVFYQNREKITIRRELLILAGAVGTLGLVLIKYLQSGTFQWNGIHVAGGGYYYFSTFLLAGSIFLLITGKKNFTAAESFLANAVGRNTQGIFCMHMAVYHVANGLLYPKIAQYNGWLLNLAESLVIVAVCTVATIIMKKIPVLKKLV